jgi:hypothetical protein
MLPVKSAARSLMSSPRRSGFILPLGSSCHEHRFNFLHPEQQAPRPVGEGIRNACGGVGNPIAIVGSRCFNPIAAA